MANIPSNQETNDRKKATANADYDLTQPLPPTSTGLRQNLAQYGDTHFALFLRKAFIKALGYSEDALSRPIIGIINTYSDFNPCHSNVPQLIQAVKRGVQLAGGLAMEFPTISVHESFSGGAGSLYLRNLMSIDTEEMISAQPVDSVVMIGGCDKTVPAQLMGGLSANKPLVHLVTGPMMPGSFKGNRVGACTDCRGYWARYRAGEVDVEDIGGVNDELAPTGGTCGVMGTASTMACLLVALGLMPLSVPSATAPAVSASRLRVAEETGRLATVALLPSPSSPSANSGEEKPHLRPQSLLTRESFLNAITVLQALGGSTNAIVHLMAIVGRHERVSGEGSVTLNTIDEIGRKTPLLVDLKPSGENYMPDFHNAGGMPALLQELRPLLHLDAMTVTGRTLGEELDQLQTRGYGFDVIHRLEEPIYPASSLVVLRGNLAPNGAVMKASASKERRLLRHTGRAVVFDGSADLAARIDSEELDVDEDCVLVLQGIGPKGNPGMPEAGLVPIPKKLAKRGVKDMLRISDGRMSGTAGGSVVLHVSPESADLHSVFGLVKDGDLVTVDVAERVVRLEVGEEEIRRRLLERTAKAEELRKWGGGKEEKVPEWDEVRRGKLRGYRGLFTREVLQADEGCDLRFLRACGPEGAVDGRA